MTGYRPWSEVKAEKQRRDAARGRVPTRSTHDPDRFTHTRGPHEGEYSDGEHVCVPECSEDTSHMMEDGHWVVPRPRYRVLTEPWYDHDPGHHGGHVAAVCAAGYALEVWVKHPDAPSPLNAWRLLGTTQIDSGPRLNLDEVHELLVDYVATLAAPHPVNVDPTRIEVYRRVVP